MIVKRNMVLFMVFVVLIPVMVFTLSGCNSCNKENSKPVDKTAPTTPNGIAITAVSSSEIKVSWKPAADDSGKVKGYKIYKNGQYLKTIEAESVSDTGLTPKEKICYRISAIDGAGNESAQSTEVCAIL